MTFKIGDTVSKKITLEQLTAGLDPAKDKKKIDRITQIFNKYNTNVEGRSADALDMDEQVSIMNAYHKADGDNDNHVSRRSLRKAGFAGEYKAYRDFMAAYQKAVGETQNTYDLTFEDGTVDGEAFTQTTATQAGENLTVQHEYVNSQKLKSTYDGAEGTVSYSPKGQLLQQTIDGATIKYRQYDSEAKNAAPGIILVSSGEGQQRLELQEDGTYMDKTDNSHYRLNDKKLLDQFTVDDKNRITAEVDGDNVFQYTYEDDAQEPSTITLNANTDGQMVFTRENDLYVLQNGDKKEYFTFDAEQRVFTETEAPKPVIKKQARPTQRHLIKMTAGWKNQKVKPDEDMTAKFNSMSSAQEVLAELVKGHEGNLDQETLLADLIKNNPSMFDSDGKIYSNALWDRLDFPKNLASYEKNT